MELKEISIDKIKANPLQPRETFDRDKLKDLAKSIKEVGLISPIQIRKKGKGYEIVSGERRWKAHQIAKKKKVFSLIKEYKDEGQVAVESLIENVHREDLSEGERYKFLKRIMEIEKILNVHQLSKRVGLSHTSIRLLFDIQDTRKKLPIQISKEAKYGVIQETIGLPDKDRKKLIEKVVKEDIGQRRVREVVKKIKEAPEVADEIIDEIGSDTDMIDNIVQKEKIKKLLKVPEKKEEKKLVNEENLVDEFDDVISNVISANEYADDLLQKLNKTGMITWFNKDNKRKLKSVLKMGKNSSNKLLIDIEKSLEVL